MTKEDVVERVRGLVPLLPDSKICNLLQRDEGVLYRISSLDNEEYVILIKMFLGPKELGRDRVTQAAVAITLPANEDRVKNVVDILVNTQPDSVTKSLG